MKILPFTTQFIDEIATSLEIGIPVVFPTDTIFGIHLPYGSGNLAKINKIKARSENQPCNVIYADIKHLTNRFKIDYEFFNEMANLTPSITLIVDDGTLEGQAIRKINSKDDVLYELLLKTGPLFSTSANVSGETYVGDPEIVSKRLDLLIYGFDNVSHVTIETTPSTIIDIRDGLKIIREGNVSGETIIKRFHK